MGKVFFFYFGLAFFQFYLEAVCCSVWEEVFVF